MKSKNPKEMYYNIEFQDETKREVNPIKLRNFLSDKSNQKVKELATDSKNRFSFKVKPILRLNLLSYIKKFEDFSCETTFHSFLNETKGIIYLQNCEFNEEIKKKLKETFPFIGNAIEESFTKSLISITTLVILTFNFQEQPYSCLYHRTPIRYRCIQVPRPAYGMSYGHTNTRFRRKVVCRKCGEDNHTSDKTSKCPKESNCTNCGEGHMAGSNCEVEIKEKEIKKTEAADNRVGRRRALQILAGKMSLQEKPSIIPYTFQMQNDPVKKIKFIP